MEINQLLNNVNAKIYGNKNLIIKSISANSKDIQTNGCYIAIKGFNVDGHCMVDEAIKNGAVAVIVERKLNLPNNVTQIVVKNTRKIIY